MEIINKIDQMRKTVCEWKCKGETVGLVPTMGFLHAGHKSLIDAARRENDHVVVSVFVNPIQFGPNEDYEKYPRDLEADSRVCEQAGVDVIFAPSVSEMYPSPNLVYVDVMQLGDHLCGARRKGHFRGVCTVVSKLFNIVPADRAYFGMKDIQQLMIMKRMVFDLNFPVTIVPCPIVREADGLALSSRNSYLTPEERKAAPVIYKSLMAAKKAIDAGETDVSILKKVIARRFSKEPLLTPDYIDIVDMDTLQPISTVSGSVIIAVAAFLGKTRLIDNIIYEGK